MHISTHVTEWACVDKVPPFIGVLVYVYTYERFPLSLYTYVHVCTYCLSVHARACMHTKCVSCHTYLHVNRTPVAHLLTFFSFLRTLFLIRDSHNDKSVPGMFSVVKMAISAVGSIYCLVSAGWADVWLNHIHLLVGLIFEL